MDNRFSFHLPMPQIYCEKCDDITSHQASRVGNGEASRTGMVCESCQTFKETPKSQSETSQDAEGQ